VFGEGIAVLAGEPCHYSLEIAAQSRSARYLRNLVRRTGRGGIAAIDRGRSPT